MTRKFSETQIFIFSALIILIAAIFSDGFYHLDEHYQILEFASYKLGISGLEDMPWEFQEKMRPTIQPWIAYWTHQILKVLGNKNPLLVAMTLRIISGLLALITVHMMFNSFKKLYKSQYHITLLALSLIIWFDPYLMVRFSSENWGGMFFFIAVATIFKYKELSSMNYLLVGIFLGLSFFIRFQMAFAIIGLVGYLFYSKIISMRSLPFLVIGGFVSIISMILSDYLFYDKLVFTPYEYFKQNILLDKASNFGVDPWWMYFGWFIDNAFIPIAIPVLFGFYLLLKNKKLAVFNWIWVPFVFGHFLVGHKELRFLFPLIYLIPYALIEFWKKISPMIAMRIKIVKPLLFGLAIWNIGLLVYSSVTPAKSFVHMYSQTNKYVEPNSIIYLASQNNEEWNYPLKYFLDPSITVIRADSNVTIMKVNDRPHYVWIKKSELEQSRDFLGDSITATIPQWVYAFDFNGWVGRERNFILFRVKEN